MRTEGLAKIFKIHRMSMTVGLMVLTNAGCLHQKTSELDALLEPLLATADGAWVARGEGGFDAVAQPLDSAHALAPQDPRVLWRMARLFSGQALAAEQHEEEIHYLSQARETSLVCLRMIPSGSTDDEQVWTGNLATIGPEATPCLGWAGFSWVRWRLRFGIAASGMDERRIEALLTQIERQPGNEELVAWTRGLEAITKGDIAAAETWLERAIREQPGELSRRADLLEWVSLPRGDHDEARLQIGLATRLPAQTPEDRRAVVRIQAAIP